MKKEFSFRIINRKSSGNNFEKISSRFTLIDLELPSIEDVEVRPPPLPLHPTCRDVWFAFSYFTI